MRSPISLAEDRRTGLRVSVAAVAVGTVIAFALPGVADISGIEPSSGRVQQGASTSAKVHIQGINLTCLSATASQPTITVTLDLSTACATGNRTVAMNVSTTALTPLGEHTITLTEVDGLAVALDQSTWKLEVYAPVTTTTTTTSSSTTTSPSSSTTSSTTTTSTTSTTTSTTSPTPSTSTPSSLPESTTTTARGEVPLDEPTTTTTTTTTTTPTAPGAGPGGPSEGSGPPATPGSDTISPLTQTLRSALAPLLPPGVADIVVSPLLIAEVIARALLASGLALIPTALLGIAVGWAATRLVPSPAYPSVGASATFLAAPTSLPHSERTEP